MKRETIAYERILYYMGKASLMYFAFRVKVKGTISKQELAKALLKVQRKHPLAGVRVIMTEDKKQFITTENVPEIPLQQFDGNKISWETIAEEELFRSFDIFKGPMIRVFLIQRKNISDIVVIFHHAVSDGLAAVVFLHHLFLFLANPRLPVNPYKEAPIFTRLIKKDILKMIKKKEMPEWLKSKNEVELKPRKEVPLPKSHYVIKNWSFTENDVKKIITLAKENGTSVHGILGAVFLKSFALEFGPKGSFQRTLQSPVSFRPFLVDEAKEYFGLFNGILKVNIDCSPERTIAQIAADIYTGLKKQLDDYDPLIGYYFFNEYFLEGIKDPELFFANQMDQPMDYDFSLSNLGIIPMQKEYGRYEIEKVYGPIFSAIREERVISVNTHQGRMFFTFIYDRKCFNHTTANNIIQRAQKMFDDIIK